MSLVSDGMDARRRGFALPLLVLPGVALLVVIFAVPVLWLARMSFNETLPGGAMREGWTLANYAEFFDDPYFLEITLGSIEMSLAVTAIALVLSYPIALFLYRWESRWRGLLVVLTVSPLLVGAVVRTYGWVIILGDRGWVNSLFSALGLVSEPLRLVNNETGVIIGLSEILMPYMALALIAGFGRLDRSLEEAAMSLGASPVRTFLRVTLPLSLPGVALGSLLCFVLAISSFITPKLLGGGRVFLLATEIYDQALTTVNWPLASTISVMLLILFALTLALYSRLLRRLEP
jgi:putative spermidine/putrescine transport system permease protein